MLNSTSNGEALSVSVSFVSPLATATYVSPVANVSYTLPVAQIQYIELVATTITDSSGRFKYFPDAVVVSDSTVVSLHFYRNYTDSVSVSDYEVTRMTFVKQLTEMATANDTITTVWQYRRNYADSVATSDNFSKLPKKGVADSVTSSESLAKNFLKVYYEAGSVNVLVESYADPTYFAADYTGTYTWADPVTPTDSARKLLTKSFSDAVTAIDTSIYQGLTWTFADTRSDVVVSSEILHFSNTKGLADSATATEQLARAYTKVLSDSFTAGESLAKLLSKPFADSAVSGDNYSQTVSKAFSDSASTSSTGSLISQGYCDITYFAADYVGTYATFS